MPTAYVEKIAKQHNVSVKDVETLWDKAKDAVSDEHKDDYAIIVSIFKKMVKKHYDSS